jgi:hypothetical protein
MASMVSLKNITLALCVVLIGGYIVSACGNDCKDLADKICNCEPTRAKRQRCQDAVNAANSNTDLSSEQQDRCKKISDSGECTCKALLDQDFAACGLANDPATVP